MKKALFLALAGMAILILALGWLNRQTLSLGGASEAGLEEQVHGTEEPGTPMDSETFNSRIRARRNSQSAEQDGVSDPVLKWDESLQVMDFLHNAERDGHIDEIGIQHIMDTWLWTCREALILFAGPMPKDRLFGAKGEAVHKIADMCGDILPESFDLNNPDDLQAIDSLLFQVQFLSFTDVSIELKNNFEQGGESTLISAAGTILDNAMDVGSLQAAINSLQERGVFKSPLLTDLRDAAWTIPFDQVSMDVATVLFCERTGGCIGSNHPVVLQRCFKGHLGCNRPVDIHDAIYQLTPPVDYDVYSALLTETRGIIARHRRK